MIPLDGKANGCHSKRGENSELIEREDAIERIWGVVLSSKFLEISQKDSVVVPGFV